MKSYKLLFLIWVLSCGFTTQYVEHTEEWFGSTPCNNELKIKLGISIKDSIDFIRWDLRLNDSKHFELKINYGLSQPNTLGFISSGQHKSFEGTVSDSKTKQGITVRTFTSSILKSGLSFIELSSSVIHLLDKDNNPMIGNGGWSYSLSNKNAPKTLNGLPTNISPLDLNIENSTITFAGRTPCEPVNSEYNLSLSDNCIKIKWLMKLYVDPVTKRPTSFNWNRTGNRTSLIEGVWSIEKKGGALICHLQPRKPFEPIDMLIVDKNILYFLDKHHTVMTGDENFSFVLNRVLK